MLLFKYISFCYNVKFVWKAIYLVKMCLFICKLSIRGPKY